MKTLLNNLATFPLGIHSVNSYQSSHARQTLAPIKSPSLLKHSRMLSSTSRSRSPHADLQTATSAMTCTTRNEKPDLSALVEVESRFLSPARELSETAPMSLEACETVVVLLR
jgi:hypothetical protein